MTTVTDTQTDPHDDPLTDTANAAPPAHVPRGFRVVWAGQTASQLGTEVMAVGVAFAVFLETRSIVWLAALYLGSRLPALVVSPRAGGLVDRTSPRRVLLVADAIAGAGSLAALGLLLLDQLALWHLVVAAAVGSVANAFQFSAYQASVAALVPPTAMDRAQGMLQLTPAIGLLAAPALAGFLVGTAGLHGLLVLDVVTCLLALAATARVAVPRPLASRASEPTGSLLSTWRHLDGPRQGLRRLIVWGALVNMALVGVNLLLGALLLTLAPESTVGLLLAVGGVAMLAGGAVVSAKGLPDRRLATIVSSVIVLGLGVVLIGLRPSLPLITLGIVLALGTMPVLSAASGTLYQTLVEPSWQGRLSALRRVAAESLTLPVVVLLTPAVQWGLEPAMTNGSWGADWFGAIIGTGPGRGIALAVIGAGVLVLAIAVVMRRDPVLRSLDAVEAPTTAA